MIFNKLISLPSYVMFQEFDSESVLLDIRSQEHFGLNPISSLFLKSIQEKYSTEEACARILDEYEVEPELLHQDLDILLNTLLDHELIKIS